MSDLGYSYEPTGSTAHNWSKAMACNQDPQISSLSDRVTEIRYSPCRGSGRGAAAQGRFRPFPAGQCG